jgi:hypothetical protein
MGQDDRRRGQAEEKVALAKFCRISGNNLLSVFEYFFHQAFHSSLYSQSGNWKMI